MQQAFVDRICKALPEAERTTPFGPETVFWCVGGHMFAAYSVDGEGVSLRTTGRLMADKLIREGRAISPPELQGEGWVLVPWTTAPEELRDRIERSHRLVRQDGNAAMRPDPARPPSAR